MAQISKMGIDMVNLHMPNENDGSRSGGLTRPREPAATDSGSAAYLHRSEMLEKSYIQPMENGLHYAKMPPPRGDGVVCSALEAQRIKRPAVRICYGNSGHTL